MKTTIYQFRQVVLGLAYFENETESEYNGRKETFEDGENNLTDKVVRTSLEDMTDFEKMILDEYQENEFDYQQTLTGDLF